MTLIVPGGEPFLISGGSVGCLLLHGFTAMPAEMAWLGEYLAGRGHTVLGARLAGHATHPRDLARTRWQDWLISVEDSLAVLSRQVDDVVVMGQSMGGLVALTAAARYPMAGAVAISTPCQSSSRSNRIRWRVSGWLQLNIDKGVPAAPAPLDERCEANYPAYPRFPARILLELDALQNEMRACLAEIEIPILLIHSRDDSAVPFDSMAQIYDRLGTENKEMIALAGVDHSVVRDPQRQPAFDAIDRFVQRVLGRPQGRTLA